MAWWTKTTGSVRNRSFYLSTQTAPPPEGEVSRRGMPGNAIEAVETTTPLSEGAARPSGTGRPDAPITRPTFSPRALRVSLPRVRYGSSTFADGPRTARGIPPLTKRTPMRTLTQMEQDPPRRGPRIKVSTSWRMPPEVLARAHQYVRAGVRKSEALEINKKRHEIGLLPLFEVKP